MLHARNCIKSCEDARLRKRDRRVPASRHIGTRELENQVLEVANSEVARETKFQ
jgi:hypothetical protein